MKDRENISEIDQIETILQSMRNKAGQFKPERKTPASFNGLSFGEKQRLINWRRKIATRAK